MQGMASVEYDSGFGPNGTKGTWEWLIDPAFIVAQVVPFYLHGHGQVGIAGYRQRPDPRGAEVVVDRSRWLFNWPGTEYIDNCSSVTFGIGAGNNNQHIKAVLNLLYW